VLSAAETAAHYPPGPGWPVENYLERNRGTFPSNQHADVMRWKTSDRRGLPLGHDRDRAARRPNQVRGQGSDDTVPGLHRGADDQRVGVKFLDQTRDLVIRAAVTLHDRDVDPEPRTMDEDRLADFAHNGGVGFDGQSGRPRNSGGHRAAAVMDVDNDKPRALPARKSSSVSACAQRGVRTIDGSQDQPRSIGAELKHPRTVTTQRSGDVTAKPIPTHLQRKSNGALARIDTYTSAVTQPLRLEDNIAARTDPGQWADRAAYYWAAMLHAHRYREGNGRSIRVWIEDLAHHAGHELDWTRASAERDVHVAVAAANGDYEPMRALLTLAAGGTVGVDREVAALDDLDKLQHGQAWARTGARSSAPTSRSRPSPVSSRNSANAPGSCTCTWRSTTNARARPSTLRPTGGVG
jgi:hypothetical protein